MMETEGTSCTSSPDKATGAIYRETSIAYILTDDGSNLIVFSNSGLYRMHAGHVGMYHKMTFVPVRRTCSGDTCRMACIYFLLLFSIEKA